MEGEGVSKSVQGLGGRRLGNVREVWMFALGLQRCNSSTNQKRKDGAG